MVMDPLLTLATDFGEESPYVAAMKGVILSINPQARILDLSHQIPPQDVRHAAFFLRQALPYFPAGVLHVVVVDPGVGSERAILYVRGAGHVLLTPDNGCWTALPWADAPDLQVIHVAEPAYWRPKVSATFHGRDIFAPVAGHLSRGLDARKLGPEVKTWVRLPMASPRREGQTWHGEIMFVDHFGNLITNIPGQPFQALVAPRLMVEIGDQTIHPRWVKTYAGAGPEDIVALVSSADTLEIAVPHGNAAERLGARLGMNLQVHVEGEGEPGA
jgi:S-adenosylmethionine hydrolase